MLRDALRLRDDMFVGLGEAEFLGAADGSEPLISAADKDLYCLMRSDIMLVDLSTPGYGEQGADVLFGQLGGMPIVGITDRFQNAPSLLARIDCLIAPTRVEQIIHVVMMYGNSSPAHQPDTDRTKEPTVDKTAAPDIRTFVNQVLSTVNVTQEEDEDDGSSEETGVL